MRSTETPWLLSQRSLVSSFAWGASSAWVAPSTSTVSLAAEQDAEQETSKISEPNGCWRRNVGLFGPRPRRRLKSIT
jgi:hypothetical protein